MIIDLHAKIKIQTIKSKTKYVATINNVRIGMSNCHEGATYLINDAVRILKENNVDKAARRAYNLPKMQQALNIKRDDTIGNVFYSETQKN